MPYLKLTRTRIFDGDCSQRIKETDEHVPVFTHARDVIRSAATVDSRQVAQGMCVLFSNSIKKTKNETFEMAVISHADGVVRTRQIKPEDRTASARRAGQLPVPAGRIKIQELLLLLLRSPSPAW